MTTQQLDPRSLLKLDIPAGEHWDDATQRFFYVREDTTITLEHSLVAVSKWESMYHVPFTVEMSNKNRPIPIVRKETYDYLKCMTIEPDIPSEVYQALTKEQIDAVNNYIHDPHTATTIMELPDEKSKNRANKEIETAEVIYWEMFQCGIPIEWEHRHFNQLIMLIRVCAEKNSPGKKMPQQQVNDLYMSLNEKRKKQLRSAG